MMFCKGLMRMVEDVKKEWMKEGRKEGGKA